MHSRPNFIIFVPDHYRGEALGHMGNPCVHTPNLDALVRSQAVSFSRAFCQNPVSVPSRCSFMTGWYPHVRGHRSMAHMLRAGEPDLLSRLKDAGYFVWWGGKNDLAPAQHGFERHCDVKHVPAHPGRGMPAGWRGKPGGDGHHSFFYGKLDSGTGSGPHPDCDWDHVAAALEQIRVLPSDRPFCIYLPLHLPEPPLAVEEPFFSMIDRARVPERIPAPEDWRDKPSMLRGIHATTGMRAWSEDRWRELRAVYYGMCSRVDHQLGLLMGALESAGRYDDTAILFFSDHGMYAGDYGLVDINQNTFEDALVRVPLIFKPPAGVTIDPGICAALVELLDITATVEELADLKPTHAHFGKSLLRLAGDRRRGHRDAVFCEGGRLRGERHCMELEYPPGHQDPCDLYYPRLKLQADEGPAHTKAAMCRTDCFKYVRRLYEKDELYDLEKDPDELRNLIDAPDYREILGNLRDRMLTWYMATADTVPFDLDRRS